MLLIRGTSLTGYCAVARSLGQDPERLLREAGVRPADAGDHEAFIGYRSLVVALERLADAADRPDTGLLLARHQGIDILGPVGVAARTAPTMAGALRTFSTYLAAYSPAIEVGLSAEPQPDRTFFEFRVVATDLAPHPQVVELSVAIAVDVFRFLLGAAYQPLEVHLPHAPLSPEERYREALGDRVAFAKPRAGLVIRTADLDRPLSSDAAAHAALVRYLDGLVPADEPGLGAPVRALVRQLLPTGALTVDLVARQFRLHPKTLQRRLRAEGTTFAALVDDVRRTTADHYLRHTQLSLTQLTGELGYAEQSVLSRACRRWFGCGPRTHRRRAIAASPGVVVSPRVK